MSMSEWDKLSSQDIRLLPKYGYVLKSPEQREADQSLIKTSLKQDTTPKKASAHFIRLGFNYLYKNDLKTAMYRFNQAYLIDSTNTDIYWGYGAVYMTLQNYQKAKRQYTYGLAINPENTHLLTDLATYYMDQYYALLAESQKDELGNLGTAIDYLTKSYTIDPKDQNTLFKLSACFLNKSDCRNARKYYDACKALGGSPITEEYTKALGEKCK
jgi:Tfp pilus assembly protein PilF